jgi:predicted acetyltransferase
MRHRLVSAYNWLVAVPELTPPTTRVHASFLAAMEEFQAEGRGGRGDTSMLGREIYEHACRWADPAGFASYARWLRADAREESPRPDGYVPATTLWWVNDEVYLGRLTIRHRLTTHHLLTSITGW